MRISSVGLTMVPRRCLLRLLLRRPPPLRTHFRYADAHANAKPCPYAYAYSYRLRQR